MTIQFRLSSLRLPGALTILLSIILLAAATTGCRRGQEPGTLVIAIELPPRGFDPRFSTTSIPSARIMQLVYDTLVVKGENFDFVPSLAEGFEESPDHKRFTFRLRPGVRFHDGKPLTSADVKFTFESILSPALKSPIRGAVEKLSQIETPDPQTVIFHAREPFYTFIGSLPAIGIIPEGAGTELISSPVGSGPYRFISYREGDLVQLEANPDYWNGAPSLPRVQVKVVVDNSTRQAELMSGAVDLAYNAQFDPETIRALSDRQGLRVVVENGSNVGYLGVNLTPRSRLSDLKTRQAVAYAVNREVIINRLLRDQAQRADAVLPRGHWAYEPGIQVYDYDVDRAKQLLDAAGATDPDGDGPEPRLALTILTQTSQLSRNIAAILQDQLRRVGIALEIQSLEFATMMDKIAKAQYDLYYLISIGANQSTDVFQFVYHSRYQNPEFSDAIARLRSATEPAQMRPLLETVSSILRRREYCPGPEVDRLVKQAESLDSTSAVKRELYLRIAGILTDRGGQNRMRYCNPAVDGWIVEAERADERSEKLGYYSRIQKTVAEELPQIYLWYPANVLVASERVGNIQIEPSGSWFFVPKLTLEDKR